MKYKYKDIPGVDSKKFIIKIDKKWFDNERLIIPIITETLVEVTKIYPRTWWRRLRTRIGLKTKLVECKIIKQTNSL